MSDKILIADDDLRINELLCEDFSQEGYEVLSVYDGEMLIETMEKVHDICLIILDVMMPGMDGWEILDYVKKHFNVKVLMLTALSDEDSEVRGLRKGADDYVTKPFKRAILLERARRLIQQGASEQQEELRCGVLRLSQAECKVYDGPMEIPMTMKEYQLLLLLMQNSKIVLKRDIILEKIWGFDYTGNERTIDTHIKMLRRTLRENGAYIRTIRGVGYCFDGEVQRG